MKEFLKELKWYQWRGTHKHKKEYNLDVDVMLYWLYKSGLLKLK